MKIEPHENGPLFVEMIFYIKAARKREVERTSTTGKSIRKMMRKPTRSVMSQTMMGSTTSKKKMTNLMRMKEGRDSRKRELPSKP